MFAAHAVAVQIMAQAHTFLDRNALLLRAGEEEASSVDYQALSSAGIRKCALLRCSPSRRKSALV